MKLNLILFSFVVLGLISVRLGLPAYAPILVAVATLLLAPLLGLAYAVVVATWRTAKFYTNKKKALLEPAHELRIKERITDIKRARNGYGDKSDTHILNKRSLEYDELFEALALTIGDKVSNLFEVKSSFDFQEAGKILHTIQAKTPAASEALTELKNSLLRSAKNVDVSFS